MRKHNNRARCPKDQVVADASEEQFRHCAVSAASDHDQINVMLAGQPKEHLRWVTFLDHGGDLDPGVSKRFRPIAVDVALDILAPAFDGLVGQVVRTVGQHHGRIETENRGDDDICIEAMSQIGGPLDGFKRFGRAVHPHKNVFHVTSMQRRRRSGPGSFVTSV